VAADTREERSRSLLAGAGLLVVEGVALLAAGLWLGVRSLGDDASDRAGAATGGVVALLAGIGVLLLARATLARKRWARSPVIVLQILFLPVGVGLVQSGRPGYGVPVIVLPVAILIALGMARALTPE
jgi:hypothetical protein